MTFSSFLSFIMPVQIPYRRRYRTALSNAFEIYLAIQREVKRRVDVALGRDSPDWRVLNSCPPCAYALSGEPPQRWARVLCLDGNNSLKRLKASALSKQEGDTRVFEASDYFLPRSYVDRFAHEVRSRRDPRDLNPDGATVIDLEVPDDRLQLDDAGDPTDATPEDSPFISCTRNWKAAAAEQNKKMWGIFDETGIFASACPHGFVLWLADMVRSGEL